MQIPGGLLVFFSVVGLSLCSISLRPHSYDELTIAQFEPSIQPRSVNRLLNNTLPISYELDLTTNIHSAQLIFNGNIFIRFRALESTSQIRINSYFLTIESCTLTTASSVPVQISLYSTTDRFLDIFVYTPLVVNQEYILQVVYSGTHRSASEGFHYSYYAGNDGTTRYLASTQFQSVFAREAFPCFDEPYYRVPLRLVIRHDPSYNALSNAAVMSTNAGVTVFKETWHMPSYLLAFVVSDFQCTVPKGKQRICAQPNRMNEVNLAVEASDKILTWMEITFDEPYEHEKLDHIAIPTFQFGGMENWGLVVYHPWYLLFKDGSGTVGDKIAVTSVISHELAHMFYGNLITPKWWTYLWLSEGLATLYEFYGTHAAYPELRMNELFIVDALHRVLRQDATGNTRPMTYYVDTVNGIESIFDSISYLKAGSIFRMIKYAIGEATFHKALIKYLNTNKNSGVDEKPMYRALEEAIVEDKTAPPGIIDIVMDSWSLKGGYPLVTVQRNYATNVITISQKEFIATTNPPTSAKIWSIPITFTKRTGANFKKPQANFWFQTREQTVAHDADVNDWVIFNLQQSGYYRVNYDARNWELLITQLISNHVLIPPTNRAQMIDDINILANNQVVENRLRLALMEYLMGETDMIPLQAARVHLNDLNRMFSYSQRYNLFRRYVGRMLERTLNGMEHFWYTDEDVNTFKSRSVLIDLACSVGMEVCQTLARTLMFSELKTNTELINNEDREMIYCHGLRAANPRLFKLFLENYDRLYAEPITEEVEETIDHNVYGSINRLTRIFGCYGDKSGIQDILENILTDDFQYPRYRYRILQSIISNGHAELVMDFLLQQQDLNVRELVESEFVPILIALSREVRTTSQEEKFNAVLELLVDADFSAPAQVEVNIRNNQEWAEKHGNDLESWLAEHYSDPIPGSAVATTISIGLVLIALICQLFI